MKTVSFALAAAAILATVATAQNQLPVHKVEGPIKTLKRGVQTPKAAPVIVYENTILSNFYSTPGTNEEWTDFGTISDPDHDTITDASFGYATTNPGTIGAGPVVRMRTYDDYTGFCLSPLSPLGLDVSVSGLPGAGATGLAIGWLVTLDLNAAGACFFQDDGKFGYSFQYDDSTSGPLLASGGAGQANQFDWRPLSTGSCGQYWFGGNPWAGFYADFTGHKGYGSFGVGGGTTPTLSITGATCNGSTVSVTVGGATGDAWAIFAGNTIGAGVGGPAPGGLSWDISLGGGPPVLVLGPFTFPINPPLKFTGINPLASGSVFGFQAITKNGPAWGLSVVQIVDVP